MERFLEWDADTEGSSCMNCVFFIPCDKKLPRHMQEFGLCGCIDSGTYKEVVDEYTHCDCWTDDYKEVSKQKDRIKNKIRDRLDYYVANKRIMAFFENDDSVEN